MQSSPASLPERKLLEKGVLLEMNGKKDRKFMFGAAIFTDGRTIFRAETSYELSEIESHLDELDGVPIAREQFCPKIDREHFIKVTSPLPDNCYIKTPRLIQWNEKDSHLFREVLLAEARVCEVLMKNPHPNVAKYLGCKQDGPYLTGLCFERYKEDLYDRVMDKGMEGLSVDTILQGIRKGIDHIHSLGYCHNDISPYNIVLRSDGTPVIIDFDSCQPTSAKLGHKAGTYGFSDVSSKFSKPENDFYGLEKIEECLNRGDFCSIE